MLLEHHCPLSCFPLLLTKFRESSSIVKMEHGDHGDGGHGDGGHGDGGHGGDGGSGGEEGGMDHSGMGGMNMFFHFGVTNTILFDFWKTTDVGGLVGSVILVFFLALAYEGLKFFRDYLQVKVNGRSSTRAILSRPTSEDTSAPNLLIRDNKGPRVSMFSGIHISQTGLHFLQFVLSYFLMLIFMTYNVWLCLGVALGATAGYFIFGWQKHASCVHDPNEHCH